MGAGHKHTIRIVLTAHQNSRGQLGQSDLPSIKLDQLRQFETRWDNTYRRWVLKENYQPPVVVSSNPIEIEIVAADPSVVPNTSNETSGTPPEPKPIKIEPLSFGPVIERAVNDHKVEKDYLIDLDSAWPDQTAVPTAVAGTSSFVITREKNGRNQNSGLAIRGGR